MRVILTEYIYGLGQEGDTVNVKPGFGRNFLIPQGKALRFSKENEESFASRRAEIAARLNKLKDSSLEVLDFLQKEPFIITTQANEKGQLYGTVRQQTVFNALHEKFSCITRTSILLSMTIKEVGAYPFQVRLHPEVTIDALLYVFTSEQEALDFIEAEKEEALRKEEERKAQIELAQKIAKAEKEAEAKAAEEQLQPDPAQGDATDTEESSDAEKEEHSTTGE